MHEKLNNSSVVLDLEKKFGDSPQAINHIKYVYFLTNFASYELSCFPCYCVLGILFVPICSHSLDELGLVKCRTIFMASISLYYTIANSMPHRLNPVDL
jgi:hypothetical protein